MARIEVQFVREVVSKETVTRVIEGDTHEACVRRARELAAEFDSSCPDDYVADGCDDCQGWQVGNIDRDVGDDAETDIRVGEPEAFTSEDILERFDAGEINDEQAIAELQDRGWASHRAYVILDEHKAR